MFGSLSRPGEPRPAAATNYQFNFSNSHFTVVPANAGKSFVVPALSRDPSAAAPVEGDAVRRLSRHNQCCGYGSLRSQGRRKLVRHTVASPRRVSPGCPILLRPKRAWGMPGGKRTRSLACKSKKARKQVTTVAPDHPAFPHANGFNGLFRARPGDRALLSPSPATMPARRSRRPTSPIIASLISASGYQAHTTSPSACCAFVWRTSSVHRIPHPTFVTIAKRPSCEAGRRGLWI